MKYETPFANLLRTYETYARNDTECLMYETALFNLATAVVYSVLKNLIAKTSNQNLIEVRADLTHDINILQDLAHNSEKAYKTVYNKNGDRIIVVADSNAEKAFNALIRETLGDGLDLVNTAVVAILDEENKVEKTRNNFLEISYKLRRLKRKIYIKDESCDNCWETIETTPIKEIYKTVRMAIEGTPTMCTKQCKYVYLEDLARDTESDTEAVIYRRLPRFADLGGYAYDFNGKYTLYSASQQMVEDFDYLNNAIKGLKLTPAQDKILKLRLEGYGYKAIATYLGITTSAVTNRLSMIRKKVIKSNLFSADKIDRIIKR